MEQQKTNGLDTENGAEEMGKLVRDIEEQGGYPKPSAEAEAPKPEEEEAKESKVVETAPESGDSDEELDDDDDWDDDDDEDEEDEAGDQAPAPAVVAAATPEVVSSASTVKEIQAKISIELKCRCKRGLDEPIHIKYKVSQDKIQKEFYDLVNRVQQMLPADEMIRVDLAVYKPGGGRGFPGNDVCMRPDFVKVCMRHAEELDEAYRAWALDKPHGEVFRPDEEPEEGTEEEEEVGFQEKLMAGLEVANNLNSAAVAINEVAAASGEKWRTTGETTSVIEYLAHPNVQKLFKDTEAVRLIAKLMGMESVVQLIRGIGGPLKHITFAIQMWQMQAEAGADLTQAG